MEATLPNEQPPLLDNLVRQAGSLYSLPRVAMQVLELTNRPNVDARQLKQCLENDPALTSKILRVVNSSLMGLSREVSNLNQALALLGIKPLKLLVLGFSLPEKLFGEVPEELLERYWQHAMTKAVASREIAQSWLQHAGDEFFIAGLLQDLGEMVLLKQLGQPYAAFLKKTRDLHAPLLEWEWRTLGFDHTELTSRLLAQWCLPTELVEGVRIAGQRAAEPKVGSAETMSTVGAKSTVASIRRVLSLAESIAQLLADGRTSLWDDIVLRAGRTFHVTEHDVQVLLSQLQDKISLLADLLQLNVPGVQNYNEILAAAHHQLTAVSDEVAGEIFRQQQWQQREVQNLLATGELDGMAEASALADSLSRISAGQRASVLTKPPEKVAAYLPAETGALGRQAGISAAATFEAASVRAPSPLSTAAAASPGGVSGGEPSGDWQAIRGPLAAAVAWCRQSRAPLSLLLAEVDNYEGLAFDWGMEAASQALAWISTACRRLTGPEWQSIAVREACFALILLDCERREAVEMGHGLQVMARDLGQRSSSNFRLSMSVGIATVALPPRNFASESLIDSARRCLFAGAGSGGDSLKSIEIY